MLAKIDYLVSHSGRALLPQTQGWGHVSQHLIHVRVRHATPGSTKNKKQEGVGGAENQKGGLERRRRNRKRKKPKNKKTTRAEKIEKEVENDKIDVSNKWKRGEKMEEKVIKNDYSTAYKQAERERKEKQSDSTWAPGCGSGGAELEGFTVRGAEYSGLAEAGL